MNNQLAIMQRDQLKPGRKHLRPSGICWERDFIVPERELRRFDEIWFRDTDGKDTVIRKPRAN